MTPRACPAPSLLWFVNTLAVRCTGATWTRVGSDGMERFPIRARCGPLHPSGQAPRHSCWAANPP